MFEILDAITQAYREVAHLAEWTGLSIGIIVGLGALVYFDPALRKIAIRIAVGVICAYLLTMYAYHIGIADKKAEWDRANARAAAEIKQRDDNAAVQGATDAADIAANLQAGKKLDQEQVDALRKLDASCHPIVGDQLR